MSLTTFPFWLAKVSPLPRLPGSSCDGQPQQLSWKGQREAWKPDFPAHDVHMRFRFLRQVSLVLCSEGLNLSAPRVTTGHGGNKLCLGYLFSQAPRGPQGKESDPYNSFPALSSPPHCCALPIMIKTGVGLEHEQDQKRAEVGVPPGTASCSVRQGPPCHQVPPSCSEVASTPLLCTSFCEPEEQNRQALPHGVHKENKNSF